MSKTAQPQIQYIRETGMASNSFIIQGEDYSYLVDPSQRFKFAPDEEGSEPIDPPIFDGILLTHGHYDHIRMLNEFRSDQTPVYVHEEDARFLTDTQYNLSGLFGQPTHFEPAEHLLQNGSIIDLAPDLKATVYHTPGHTPGSCCYLLQYDGEPIAFLSGDTIFMDSIGRTDFPGGNSSSMNESLENIKKWAQEWPEDLAVFPGHGPVAPIGQILKYNMWLR
ncbi:MAG TPA: MBL fold metallo-hydrolase [Clostridiaceae bacterium]|nr:MBL fold metallo-hydrolase [Clostridiaceae bacterium]